ncbi:MAG: heparinase II/III family protein [Solirubrobacterales bacterium]
MERETTAGRRAGLGGGWARLLSILVLVGALIAASPEPAGATARVPKGAVRKLDRSPCPPKYAVRVARPATAEEISAAKHGDFNIAGVGVHIRRKMDWTYDPVGSATFRARLHDLRWLDPLFYAYRENHDVSALQRAKRIVVDWVENNPLKNPTTDRTWFDKVAGDRGPYIAYATRAAECEGLLKNQRLARKLMGSVLQHVRFLADRRHYSPTNRGLFMDLGLIFSGRQMKFLPGATKARNRGQRRFVSNVNSNVIPGEGMWLEHSTTYQFLAVNAIDRFLEIDKKSRPGLEGLLQTMEDTAAWMTEPDLNWLQAGDSYQDKADRFAQKISRDQRGLRVLSQSGIAFVKTAKSYLALLSNYHSAVHRHSDDLSFDLYENKHRVVADTGIPDKDFGTPYLFAISTAAHSVVQVDGMDFPRDDANAYGSGLLASGEGSGWYGLLATNPLVSAQGVSHNRLLLYKPGSALIVADRLRSAQGHSYRSYFHYGPDFGLNMTPDKVQLFAGSDRVSVFNDSTDPTLQRQVVRGQSNPLQGFIYTDFRTRDPRWTESTTAEGDNVDNVTTISVNPNKEIHASAVGQLEDTTSFAISENGEVKKTLTVTRQEGQLIIQEADAPAVP